MKGIFKKLTMVVFIALLVAGCTSKNTAKPNESSSGTPETDNSNGEDLSLSK